MASLFIDSTYDITLGILDEGLGWIKFEKFYGQKVSNIIQQQTHVLLQQSGLRLSQMDSIITVAGPGFYTGLRLSEGFADVMTFSDIKHHSFLSYSVPQRAHVESGTWMTKAYRGEYFFHTWSSTGSKNELISSKDLEAYLANKDMKNFYIHSESSIDDLSRKFLKSWLTTHDILQEKPKLIFDSIVKSKTKTDSFYFRAPEDEFRVST